MYEPNFDNCLVNLSNSMLAHFHAKPYHSTIKEIDELIKDKKKVVVVLCDGQSDYVLKSHPKQAKGFLNNVVHQITSVFPPTTVAATTSFLSGKYPGETAFLGWNQPIHDFSQIVEVFTNVDAVTREKIPGKNIIASMAPYTRIDDVINQANGKEIAHVHLEGPVGPNEPFNLKGLLKETDKELKGKDEYFAYVYEMNPDHTIHKTGVKDKQVGKRIKSNWRAINHFAKKNKDVAVFVIADHGLLDIRPLFIEEHPDLCELIKVSFSFEGRTPNFKLKDGVDHNKFKELFLKYYGNDFHLYTREEVFNDNIFTKGEMCDLAKSFIGDFVATSLNDSYLATGDPKDFIFTAHHAGKTYEEMVVDVIGLNVDKK